MVPINLTSIKVRTTSESISAFEERPNMNSEWYGYINGGDGLVVATCYPGNHFHSGTSGQGDVSCPKVFAGDFEVYDQLVCYSYFCQ